MIGDPAKLSATGKPRASRWKASRPTRSRRGRRRARPRAASSSPGGGAGPTAADLRKLEDAVKSAHLELWVGTDDHRVHKVALTLAVAMTAEQQKMTGAAIDSLDITFAATSVASEPPAITAPESPRTGEQFDQELFCCSTAFWQRIRRAGGRLPALVVVEPDTAAASGTFASSSRPPNLPRWKTSGSPPEPSNDITSPISRS